jgi:hypothetical protein
MAMSMSDSSLSAMSVVVVGIVDVVGVEMECDMVREGKRWKGLRSQKRKVSVLGGYLVCFAPQVTTDSNERFSQGVM